MRPLPKWAVPLGGLGIVLVSLLVSLGTLWAFQRGGPDFTVFYEAWSYVLDGQGARIYHTSTDRFLYAPGFAWLLCPLGMLPRSVALALWCFMKAAVIGYVVREFQSAKEDPNHGLASIGLAAWGVALFARPLLIDFQYGQVNVFILGACAWALLGHFRARKPGVLDFIRWFVLAIAALAKVFPLPLLIVPWVVTASIHSRRLRLERAGLIAGLVLMLVLPVLTQGIHGTWQLMLEWQEALLAKGLPLESHNQSFAAILHHFFSGELTHVVAEGMNPVQLGHACLSIDTISLLSLAWTLITGGFLLNWILNGASRGPLRWIAVLVALLIIPSHLVWKPYFVLSIPAAILAVNAWVETGGALTGIALALVFAMVNLTGFDLVGHLAGAYLEASGLMLWANLLLIASVLRTDPARKLARRQN